MTDTKVTARPWRVAEDEDDMPEGQVVIRDAIDRRVAITTGEYREALARAALIVTAVNAYDAMREALWACVEYVRRIEHDDELMKWYLSDPTRKVRAALAAAEGKETPQ